jgi:hypothetical protein
VEGCGYAATTSSALSKHKLKKHPIIVMEEEEEDKEDEEDGGYDDALLGPHLMDGTHNNDGPSTPPSPAIDDVINNVEDALEADTECED